MASELDRDAPAPLDTQLVGVPKMVGDVLAWALPGMQIRSVDTPELGSPGAPRRRRSLVVTTAQSARPDGLPCEWPDFVVLVVEDRGRSGTVYELLPVLRIAEMTAERLREQIHWVFARREERR